jgi:hypothetical protein
MAEAILLLSPFMLKFRVFEVVIYGYVSTAIENSVG